MTFTDDDLKRLKGYMLTREENWMDFLLSDLSALLARLEAAEDFAGHMRRGMGCSHDRHCNCPPDDIIAIEKYRTWRKAVGK